MEKKVLCVIRTSSERQELESQHNDMLGFLKGKFNEDEIEWLEVAGASARQANQKYLQMLDTIKATILANPTIKAAAFWHLNRLGRIKKYIVEMQDWFVRNKIQVYVKTPSLTLLDENGKEDAAASISWGVFAAVVASNTEEMMEKLKRGKAANKEKNKYNGGFVTYGFKVDTEGYIQPNHDELQLIKELYEEYATGMYSIQKLFNELKSRGLRFSYSHLSIILSNQIYIPYVGIEMFDKVQAIKKNNDIGINSKEYKHIHLCNKIIKCPYCGGNYIADSNHYYCFMSKHYNRVHKLQCKDAASIKSSLMDILVWDIAFLHNVMSLFNFDETAKKEQEKKKNIVLQKINTSNNFLIDCEEKIRRVVEMYGDLLLTKSQFESKIKKIESDKQSAVDEIKKLENEVKLIDAKIESLQKPNFIEQLSLIDQDDSMMSIEKKKEIIHKYIKTVFLYRDNSTGRKATRIVIEDIYGGTSTYINDYYKRGKTDVDNVVEVKGDKFIPYIQEINGKKSASRYDFIKDNFKNFIITALNVEQLLKNEKINDHLKDEIIKLRTLQAELLKYAESMK